MKKFFYGVFLILFVNSISAQDVINYFEVGSNISTPVTIYTNKGKYVIYGGERIDGNLYRVTAYDAEGNKIVQNTPYKTHFETGNASIRYYRFTSTYGQSSTSDEPVEIIDDGGSSSGSWGKQLADNLDNLVGDYGPVPMKGYPNLQVRALWSSHFGELLALQTELGGLAGYYLAGAIGKDLQVSQAEKTWSWFAEVGYYGGNEQNTVNFGMLLGRNQNPPGTVMLGAVLKYSRWFGDTYRWGMFGGVSFGAYIVGEHYKVAWDISLGVSYKLFTD